LLDYENAQIAHSNEKALNGLVKETKDENSKMRILTVSSKSSHSETGLTALQERSTADAAAVRHRLHTSPPAQALMIDERLKFSLSSP
jgi:hypothetical protein